MSNPTVSPSFPDDLDWYSATDFLEPSETEPASPDVRAASPSPLDAAQWAPDPQSPDYRHLGVPIANQHFTFTATHLTRLCELNHFSPDGGQDEVLFGLRGCKPGNGTSNEFSDSVELAEDVPDHRDSHCVLGVWKRSTGRLAVFEGSTVPNRRLMKLQLDHGGQVCNLLPTGRYRYRVGQHRAVRGAFIQQPDVVVLRTREDLIFETSDPFEKHSPADNIHPAFRDDDASFSSAGCMTIPGRWSGADGHRGAWSDFRRCAGLTDEDESHWDEPFIYVLFTGREARLASSGAASAGLNRLRLGSNGGDVTRLQESLTNAGFPSGAADGAFGANTAIALIRRQQALEAGVADGIAKPPFSFRSTLPALQENLSHCIAAPTYN